MSPVLKKVNKKLEKSDFVTKRFTAAVPDANSPPQLPLNLHASMPQTFLFLAFVAIFVGYFMVWLPHETAGLSFIGLEMGEQAKFLPAVREGQILPDRSLFYLPPITLALMIVLLAARWPNRRWQTWAARVLAIAVSLLAFPALEALGTDSAEWLWRILMILSVVLVAVMSSVAGRRLSSRVLWLLILLVALAGAILPTWAFQSVRPLFASLLLTDVGIGPGVWLNGAGHLLAAVIAAIGFSRVRNDR